jgi:hypothetical protein
MQGLIRSNSLFQNVIVDGVVIVIVVLLVVVDLLPLSLGLGRCRFEFGRTVCSRRFGAAIVDQFPLSIPV